MSNIVSAVAEKAGISFGVVSKMLPVAATLLGGLLSKSASAGGNLTDTLGQLSSATSEGVLGTVKNLVSKMVGRGADGVVPAPLQRTAGGDIL